MIHHFDFDAPLTPEEQTMNDAIHQMAGSLSAAYLDHVNTVFAQAIVNANGGVLPTDEDIDQWCQTFIGADGTHYLLWKAPAYGPGEQVDMSHVIAQVPPVKFKENQ